MKTKIDQDLSYSVVKIEQASRNANVFEMWAPSVQKSTSTGFFIEHNGKKVIITNAHCVSNTICTMVRFPKDPLPSPAKVIAISYHFDLAMLECSDEGFLNRAIPLQIAEKMPEEKNPEIFVHGFPRGLPYAITKGTISRIDVRLCTYTQEEILNLTMDITQQAGNSGGPIIYKNQDGNMEVMGVTHQGEHSASGTAGFAGAISLSCLKHFLDHPEGVPRLPFKLQQMTQPMMRKKYTSMDSEYGALIVEIDTGSSAAKELKINDVVLEIDGHPLKVNGTIIHSDAKDPINFIHLINMHAIGDVAKLKIMRTMDDKSKVTMDVEVVLAKSSAQTFAVVKNRYNEKNTDYFAAHGLVFTILTKQNTENIEKKYYDMAEHGKALALHNKAGKLKTNDRSQFVVISNVLRCEKTEGLQGFEQCIIDIINGVQVKNLHHLMDLLNAEPDKGVHKLVLENGNVIMLEHLSAEKNVELLKSQNMPATQAPASLIQRHEKRKRMEENASTTSKKPRIENADLAQSTSYPATLFESKVTPQNDTSNDVVMSGFYK